MRLGLVCSLAFICASGKRAPSGYQRIPSFEAREEHVNPDADVELQELSPRPSMDPEPRSPEIYQACEIERVRLAISAAPSSARRITPEDLRIAFNKAVRFLYENFGCPALILCSVLYTTLPLATLMVAHKVKSAYPLPAVNQQLTSLSVASVWAFMLGCLSIPLGLLFYVNFLLAAYMIVCSEHVLLTPTTELALAQRHRLKSWSIALVVMEHLYFILVSIATIASIHRRGWAGFRAKDSRKPPSSLIESCAVASNE